MPAPDHVHACARGLEMRADGPICCADLMAWTRPLALLRAMPAPETGHCPRAGTCRRDPL